MATATEAAAPPIERGNVHNVPSGCREQSLAQVKKAGFGSVGRGFARQRIVFAFVQPADAIAVEAFFLDLQIGAEQQFRR
jgi:hypothetical protein